MSTQVCIDWDCRKIVIEDRENPPCLVFDVIMGGIKFRGKNLMFILPDDKTAQISVSAVDIKGFSAPIENIVYSSSDDTMATVDQNGLVVPNSIGDVSINAIADAEIGPGITQIGGILDITIMPSQAVALSLSAVIV